MKPSFFIAVLLLCRPVIGAETTRAAAVAPDMAGGTTSSRQVTLPANAVAVVDFEMADTQSTTPDWAFGLADVLAVELRQRGALLFERQQIRVVLGERRITTSGLVQLRKSPFQEIPDLRYLVTGSLRPLNNQQCHLEVSLVEAQTGRNAASFAREGRYPAEVAGALAELAGQIASHLKSAGAAMEPQREVEYRSGRTPEVSLLFYRGIAHCLAGQPELGVTWFIDTLKADPHFLPARLWAMRAYQMAGLPDFAAVAREQVREAPNGQGVLNRIDESRFLDQKLVSVAVIADPRIEADGWKFQSELKMALGRNTNLFVADASNIRSLAAEMDLQLTEKGARDLELTSVMWSAMDALVLVSTDPSHPGGYSVELRDALSGEVLFSSPTSRDFSQLDQVSRDLVEHIRAHGKRSVPFGPAHDPRNSVGTDSTPSPISLSSREDWGRSGIRPYQVDGEISSIAVTGQASRNERAAKPVQVINTDRDEFAGLLKYLAENPSDRPAWMRLALFVRWLGGSPVSGYECAISDRVVAATDLTKSEAASWLSVALWHRRRYENPPSLAVEAATLLERFPESPESQYVRSALALEHIDQHQNAEAAKILLKLGAELPRLAEKVDIGPDYLANFHYFTGAVFHELGNDQQANRYFAQADEVFQKNPGMPISDPNTFGLGVWRNHFPIRHPLFGPDRDLRQAITEWNSRMRPAQFTQGKSMTVEQLEVMLTQARQMTGPEARLKRVEAVQRFIEHQQSHPGLYQGRVTDSVFEGPYRKVEVWRQGTTYGHFTLPGKLVMETIFLLGQLAADSSQDIAETRRLAEALADPLDAPIAANCFEAVGEFDRALEKVEQAVRHPTPFPPLSIGMHPTREQTATRELRQQKIRLLQALSKPSEAAAYARTQAQISQADADAQLAAVTDAAETCIAMGRADEACQLYAGFVRNRETDGTMTSQSAAARIRWADQETARGNPLEASEILRAVAKQSEGKDWGIYLRTGYTKAYEAAVSRLAQLRSRSRFPVISTDWEQTPQPKVGSLDMEGPELTDMQRELGALLRGVKTGSNTVSYGGAQVDAFVQKHGHAAVPTILQAAAAGGFRAHLIARFKLLDRVSTPDDAPLVLEAFKTAPQLATVAFRMDPTNAAVILRERFGSYAKGGNIPEELRDVLGEYQLQDQYPILLANLAAKPMNGNTSSDAAVVDRILRRGASPEMLESFRAVLASILQKQMLANYRYGLANLGEIALRNGVPEGIEALIRSETPVSSNSLTRLRKYVELPAEDAKALAVIQAGLGRWRWEAKPGKFITSQAGSPR